MAVEEGDWFFPVIPPYCNSSCCQVTYHSLAVVPSLRALLVHWPSLNHFPPSLGLWKLLHAIPYYFGDWNLGSWTPAHCQIDQNDDRISHYTILLCFVQYLTVTHAGHFRNHWRMLISTKNAHFKQTSTHHVHTIIIILELIILWFQRIPFISRSTIFFTYAILFILSYYIFNWKLCWGSVSHITRL